MRALAALLLLASSVTPRTVGAKTGGPPSAAPPPVVAAAARLERVARGLELPVALEVSPGDKSGRLFVVEKTGAIRILRGGVVAPRPFLDLRGEVSRGMEQGLLGLAFHPDYARTRRLYVNYTDRRGDTHVVEYRTAVADPDRVDPASARVLLFVKQPYANHNGGGLEFGPDGKLYVGLGDGGAAYDPHGHGQDARSLLGKMLRIDVDRERPAPEVVATGLRNPWRYAFDRATGDLYIADVGQDRWEEVNVVPRRGLEGRNFGWAIVEGVGHCVKRKSCKQRGLTAPVVEYPHPEGCSITGGLVYRGKAIPALAGMYLYGDYCTGLLRAFRWREGRVADHWDLKAALDPERRVNAIASFGEDHAGELYVVALTGEIWKLVPRARK